MGGRHVLMVDDNPMNLKLLRVTLGGRGYRLGSARSAEEALALLQADRPDLILLDIQLPGMDGLTLARRLRSDPATRHIGIIAITSLASAADEQRALEAGCDTFVRKPIDTRSLPLLGAQALGSVDPSRDGPDDPSAA